MKIRIKGDSLRLRVSRPEVERIVRGHRVAETVHFGADEQAKLTYSLEKANQSAPVSVRYEPQHVAVSLSEIQALQWAHQLEVGVYSSVMLTSSLSLEVIIEKERANSRESAVDARLAPESIILNPSSRALRDYWSLTVIDPSPIAESSAANDSQGSRAHRFSSD